MAQLVRLVLTKKHTYRAFISKRGYYNTSPSTIHIPFNYAAIPKVHNV